MKGDTALINLHKHRYEYFEEINEGILRHIPKSESINKLSVLDIGCGSGALSEALQKRGYEVWGIEENVQAAKKAQKRITKVLNTDLHNISEIKTDIKGKQFDYLVFSDVLEHIYDPYLIIRQYSQFLKKGGTLLVSVPNAVVWTNRIKFLFGFFNYTDTGVMDRTHIRFFTFKTVGRIIKEAGYEIAGFDYTPYITRSFLPVIKKVLMKGRSIRDINRRQLIDSPFYKFYLKYIYPVEYRIVYPLKRLFAFRIIVAGRKKC